jgi:hypothetical protein
VRLNKHHPPVTSHPVCVCLGIPPF